MIVFYAPWPVVERICFLPNPEWNDTRQSNDDVQLKKALNGTRYTYVKTTYEKTYSMTFDLYRQKAIELLEFIEDFAGKQWRMTTHHDEYIDGYLMTNPSTFTMIGRAVYGSDTEKVTLPIEFRGISI